MGLNFFFSLNSDGKGAGRTFLMYTRFITIVVLRWDFVEKLVTALRC